MKDYLKTIEDLTPAQKTELDKDIQELHLRLQHELNFHKGHVKDVNINVNLLDEVFLNLTVEFEPSINGIVKGKIVQIDKYPNKEVYHDAINDTETRI
ncbi:hypothetical protein [Gillisia hiemivivida]|jgi:hypothetical protein|uniref:Uncharacterized protein n=1 Tax=Gillisia hiemivivida TaxID=291190 RepID=A0A5C6ZWF9_9FLAO|nr:hypothetical protein [Gillisia hiemivivida]TXD95195.1 hypothetical protein ES724_03315 [Gillisia hiemivivida]